jgi:hypothetical protein
MQPIQLIALSFFSIFLFNACEEKRESHVRPYMAKEQPRFYMNGKIEHLKKENQVIHRIAFIGDAGNAAINPNSEKLFRAMGVRLNKLETAETLVFLGDNIYDKGFQGNQLECGNDSIEAKNLDAQLYLGKATRNISYFLPGNHDWDYHEEPDLKLMKKQKKYLEDCGRETRYVPSEGDKLSLVSNIDNNLFTMIFLDSHALMTVEKTKQDQAYAQLKEIFNKGDSHKPVIITAHHPIATYGPHGGCYQQDYFGHSVINFFRRNGISWGQDINAKEYAAYIQRLNSIIPKEKRVLFIAGHDHSLQILSLEEGADYSIVSGSGSNLSPACHGDNTLFAQEALGYVEISFRQEGQLTAEVFSLRPEQGILSKVYSQRLF